MTPTRSWTTLPERIEKEYIVKQVALLDKIYVPNNENISQKKNYCHSLILIDFCNAQW